MRGSIGLIFWGGVKGERRSAPSGAGSARKRKRPHTPCGEGTGDMARHPSHAQTCGRTTGYTNQRDMDSELVTNAGYKSTCRWMHFHAPQCL